MIPHFMLKRGKKEYLIIRMGDTFHIIDADEQLTKEKRTAILEQGCTPAQMQQMGLSGMSIPKSDIRSLTVTGSGYMDDVIFLLKKQKLAFWFPQAYEQKKVDDFFRGIPRKQYKTRFRVKGTKGSDWHMREQHPDVRRRMKPVGLVLKWAAGLTCVGMLWRAEWLPLWLSLGILWAAAALFLLLFYEPYFTLMDSKEYRKAGYSGEIISLNIMPFLPLVLLLVTVDRYTVIGPDLCLVYGICAGLILTVLMWLFLRELHENLMHAAIFLLASLFLCSAAAIHANHCFAAEEMTTVRAQVVDKEKHRSRRSSDHDLIVLLEDGTRLNLDVSAIVYDTVDVGDTVAVHIRTGILDTEYAMFGGT